MTTTTHQNVVRPYAPGLIVPLPVFLHSAVSFHMQMLMATEQLGEGIFHWRQIRYYTDYANQIQGIYDYDEKKTYEEMRRQGQTPLFFEKIDKWQLLDLE